MRGCLIVKINILGKTQKNQSGSFLSSICWHTCHLSRVKMSQILCSGNHARYWKVLCKFVDSFSLQTHVGVPSPSVYLFLFLNEYLLLANYMLGSMDPTMNKTEPCLALMECTYPGGQAAPEARVMWCAQGCKRNLSAPRRSFWLGGQWSLPPRGCEEWRGLSNPWERILLGNCRGLYRGVVDTSETKLKGGIIAYVERLPGLQCWVKCWAS